MRTCLTLFISSSLLWLFTAIAWGGCTFCAASASLPAFRCHDDVVDTSDAGESVVPNAETIFRSVEISRCSCAVNASEGKLVLRVGGVLPAVRIVDVSSPLQLVVVLVTNSTEVEVPAIPGIDVFLENVEYLAGIHFDIGRFAEFVLADLVLRSVRAPVIVLTRGIFTGWSRFHLVDSVVSGSLLLGCLFGGSSSVLIEATTFTEPDDRTSPTAPSLSAPIGVAISSASLAQRAQLSVVGCSIAGAFALGFLVADAQLTFINTSITQSPNSFAPPQLVRVAIISGAPSVLLLNSAFNSRGNSITRAPTVDLPSAGAFLGTSSCSTFTFLDASGANDDSMSEKRRGTNFMVAPCRHCPAGLHTCWDGTCANVAAQCRCPPWAPYWCAGTRTCLWSLAECMCSSSMEQIRCSPNECRESHLECHAHLQHRLTQPLHEKHARVPTSAAAAPGLECPVSSLSRPRLRIVPLRPLVDDDATEAMFVVLLDFQACSREATSLLRYHGTVYSFASNHTEPITVTNVHIPSGPTQVVAIPRSTFPKLVLGDLAADLLFHVTAAFDSSEDGGADVDTLVVSYSVWFQVVVAPPALSFAGGSFKSHSTTESLTVKLLAVAPGSRTAAASWDRERFGPLLWRCVNCCSHSNLQNHSASPVSAEEYSQCGLSDALEQFDDATLVAEFPPPLPPGSWRIEVFPAFNGTSQGGATQIFIVDEPQSFSVEVLSPALFATWWPILVPIPVRVAVRHRHRHKDQLVTKAIRWTLEGVPLDRMFQNATAIPLHPQSLLRFATQLQEERRNVTNVTLAVLRLRCTVVCISSAQRQSAFSEVEIPLRFAIVRGHCAVNIVGEGASLDVHGTFGEPTLVASTTMARLSVSVALQAASSNIPVVGGVSDVEYAFTVAGRNEQSLSFGFTSSPVIDFVVPASLLSRGGTSATAYFQVSLHHSRIRGLHLERFQCSANVDVSNADEAQVLAHERSVLAHALDAALGGHRSGDSVPGSPPFSASVSTLLRSAAALSALATRNRNASDVLNAVLALQSLVEHCARLSLLASAAETTSILRTLHAMLGISSQGEGTLHPATKDAALRLLDATLSAALTLPLEGVAGANHFVAPSSGEHRAALHLALSIIELAWTSWHPSQVNSLCDLLLRTSVVGASAAGGSGVTRRLSTSRAQFALSAASWRITHQELLPSVSLTHENMTIDIAAAVVASLAETCWEQDEEEEREREEVSVVCCKNNGDPDFTLASVAFEISGDAASFFFSLLDALAPTFVRLTNVVGVHLVSMKDRQPPCYHPPHSLHSAAEADRRIVARVLVAHFDAFTNFTCAHFDLQLARWTRAGILTFDAADVNGTVECHTSRLFSPMAVFGTAVVSPPILDRPSPSGTPTPGGAGVVVDLKPGGTASPAPVDVERGTTWEPNFSELGEGEATASVFSSGVIVVISLAATSIVASVLFVLGKHCSDRWSRANPKAPNVGEVEMVRTWDRGSGLHPSAEAPRLPEDLSRGVTDEEALPITPAGNEPLPRANAYHRGEAGGARTMATLANEPVEEE